jgi:hypothetical protein
MLAADAEIGQRNRSRGHTAEYRVKVSGELALATQAQPFLSFQLDHAKKVPQHFQLVAFGEHTKPGHRLGNEG